jgi:hypothetical protein
VPWKNIVLCFALLLALSATSSQALASPLLTEGGSAIAPGAKITGVTTGETQFTIGTGKYNCEVGHLEGEVVKNSGTLIEANISSFTLGKQPEGTCSGVFRVKSVNVPWCLRMSSTFSPDTYSLRAGKCTEEAKQLTITLDFGLYQCTYMREPISDSFRTEKDGDALINITGKLFNPEATNAVVCYAGPSLDASFTLKTPNGTQLTIS